jgi:hypothetical protein
MAPIAATMIGGSLEGCGPSQPLPAVNQHHFTAPTERTPSRESASNGHSFFRIQYGERRTANCERLTTRGFFGVGRTVTCGPENKSPRARPTEESLRPLSLDV